jgi:mannose-6-phosphate isomerase-like protein (cupin superfamily)
MAEAAAFPYTTHLNIKFDPLTLIDVSLLAKTVTDQWYNQTLCKVNDSVIRLGVMQGEYHWHKHDNDDEFFFVLSGRFIIDLEGRSVELLPNQGFTVPKGVLHCTRAPEKSVILMVETAAIVQPALRLSSLPPVSPEFSRVLLCCDPSDSGPLLERFAKAGVYAILWPPCYSPGSAAELA